MNTDAYAITNKYDLILKYANKYKYKNIYHVIQKLEWFVQHNIQFLPSYFPY